MVNRRRSETWTSGFSNKQTQHKVLSYSSELSLDNQNIYLSKTRPKSFEFKVPGSKFKKCIASESVTFDSHQYDHDLPQRPVFSTSSMESIDLSENDMSIDETSDSSSSASSVDTNLSFKFNNTKLSKKDSGSSQQDISNYAVKQTSQKLSRKSSSTLSSIFNWVTSSQHQKATSAPSNFSPFWKKSTTNHLTQNEEPDTAAKKLFSRVHSSTSLDRGIPGLNSLKHSFKSFSSNSIERSASCEPNSTTALILENRPSNLPSKSSAEAEKHLLEYKKMVENAKKREEKDFLKKTKDLKERQKQETVIANAGLVWSNEILPSWNTASQSSRTKQLWWQGLPSNVRGAVWRLAIGNDLNITRDLYNIMVTRAHDKLQSIADAQSIGEELDALDIDRESTLDLIRLDISRTFPHLCIFQKGAPYHDILHDILGAYVCYRPDVGYVQGMSFIAAVLLLNMEPADAFVAFANLLNKPCQVAFYRLDEFQMKMYFSAFDVFFNENLSKLYLHFKKLNLTPDIYLIDWVFTIFSKALNLDIASRVWDLFCRDGEEFLFRTAIGILKLHEGTLIEMDFIQAAQFLTKLPTTFTQQKLFDKISSVSMTIRPNRRWKNVLAQFTRSQ